MDIEDSNDATALRRSVDSCVVRFHGHSFCLGCDDATTGGDVERQKREASTLE